MLRNWLAKRLRIPESLRIVMPEKVDRARGLPRATDKELLAQHRDETEILSPSPAVQMVVALNEPDQLVPPRIVILRRNDQFIIKQGDPS